MMMAAMKAKQGILNSRNILDIVCEGAEVGASLPGDAGFPENVEFSVGREFSENIEFGGSVPGGDMDMFMGVVDELGASCSEGWSLFRITLSIFLVASCIFSPCEGIDIGATIPEGGIVVEPFVSRSLHPFSTCVTLLFYTLWTVVHSQGAEELSATIELGASCTSGDINSLLRQIESMGLEG